MANLQPVTAPIQAIQEKSHQNPMLNSIGNASLQLAMHGAGNPLTRAILTGIHAAIHSTREQSNFLDSLFNKLSLSGHDTYSSFSSLVASTPLSEFSNKFSLGETAGASMILQSAREKVRDINPGMNA